MPGDTIYILGQDPPLPFAGDRSVDSIIRLILDEKIAAQSDEPHTDWFGALLFPMMILIFFLVAKWGRIESYFGWERKRQERKAVSEIDANGLQYHDWLNEYNPYYKALPELQKKQFLLRTAAFMQSKEFHFHAMVEEPYMPVLISGTAVQLTFGLRNYLMDYFDVIHVMRREYVLDIDKETYYGHVSKTGIHISWNHYLEGYSDYTDSVNVGLHEMAHALQFDTALGDEDRHDRNFKERLHEFSEEGRPVFRAMRHGGSHLLDDYATNNFDEFWAVSVETFFENPQEFKEKLPSLYEEMTRLLNQDPLLPEKVLDDELS